jgi:Ca2+-binding EF-hand superfamily protein
MKRVCFAVIAALAVAATPAAFAQGEKMQKLQARFASADTDHDGKLTLAEARSGMPRVAKNFDQIDATHKGYVTLGDITQYIAQRRQ